MASQGYATVLLVNSKLGDVPAANPVPAAFNCCDQIKAGLAEDPSFCFHRRYATPVLGSTKGSGSIEPFA